MNYYQKTDKEPIVKNLALMKCSVKGCHHCEVEEREYYYEVLKQIYTTQKNLPEDIRQKLEEIFK